MTPIRELEQPQAESQKRWSLSKSDLVKMLMAMDRYDVKSVVLRQQTDYLNWEIPPKRR
jgi:DNA invertase Pin-like site-specific DNA recombinase